MTKNTQNPNPKIIKAAEAAKNTGELTVLSDETLSEVAGGSGLQPDLPFVRHDAAISCDSFQLETVPSNGMMVVVCCENCFLHRRAEQWFPELAAQAAEAGLLLCGKVG